MRNFLIIFIHQYLSMHCYHFKNIIFGATIQNVRLLAAIDSKDDLLFLKFFLR